MYGKRENTAKYCSKKCEAEALKAEPETICSYCGKKFHMKKYQRERYNRNHGFFCCRECYTNAKKELMKGDKNHQYGLIGELNSSFKRGYLTKRNGHLKEIMIYAPDMPDANSNGRISLHRYNVEVNHNLFDENLFNIVNDKYVLKDGLQVHHIDLNHNNNDITNLTILSRKAHTIVHNQILHLSQELASKLIGVFKGGELLESPEVDNQQPSLSSNAFEGSETNSRVQLDSNANTSALLNQIKNLVDDYIVQTKKITEDGYKETVNKILESEIKSSEII